MTATPETVSTGGGGPVATIGSAAHQLALGWGGGSLPTPTVSGSVATYALSNTESLVVTSSSSGLSADIVLTAAPARAPTYAFPMALTGLTASSDADGSVTLSDTSGQSVYTISAPVAWDQTTASGDPAAVTPIPSTLVQTSLGAELDVSPSMAYLSAPSTQYPLTIDPTVVPTANGTTMVRGTQGGSGNTTSFGGDSYLDVGSPDGSTVNRSMIDFQTERLDGESISNATLSLFQYTAGSCSAQPMSIRPLSGDFNQDGASPTVWSNQPGTNNTNDWDTTASFNAGRNGCSPATPNSTETADVTTMVAGWAAGSLNHFGFMLTGGTGGPGSSGELATANQKTFCSDVLDDSQSSPCDDASRVPTLTVTYTRPLGLSSSHQLTQHRLNDRSNLDVNEFNGNVTIAANDINIAGVGLSLDVDRYYNSYNDEAASDKSGAFGPGWSMSVGPDIKLIRYGTGDPAQRLDYQAPSGTVFGSFIDNSSTSSPAKYYKPTNGALNANLTYDNSSGDYKLNFDQSRQTYYFAGCSDANCDPQMVKQTDAHGNTITYSYTGSGTSSELASITDTEGRTLTVHYNSAGLVDLLTDSSGRQWHYGYTNGLLTSYIDPDNAETDYGYSNGELTSITDPPGSDANQDRPTTDLSFGGGTAGQLTGISYVADHAGDTYSYSYVYGIYSAGTLSSRCQTSDNDTNSTDVTDPNGHVTTYCYRSPYVDSSGQAHGQSDQVYDGDGNKRSAQYSTDNSAQVATTPDNQTLGDSTVASYQGAVAEDVTSVTEPADGNDTPGTTQLNYDDASNPALPTSIQNPEGDCTAYNYSSAGDLTDSYTGLSGSGSSEDCSSGTGGEHNHTHYNSNGTVDFTAGPDSDNNCSSCNTVDAESTDYNYYSSGTDTGELQWVDQAGGTRPSGSGTCSASTTLCTAYTYDSLDRVTSITDGNDNTTTFHYDGIDRVTEADLGGATSCNPGHTNCYSYSYDAEGNLTSITDAQDRTRTLGYDRLNRQTSQSIPGTSRSITDSYDGVGNLLTYTDGPTADSYTDSISYSYDQANNLHTITDEAGTFNVSNDADGNRVQIVEPNGLTIKTSYHSNGQVNEIQTKVGNAYPTSYTYTYINSNSSNHNQEVDQLQHLQTSVGGSSTDYYYGYGQYGRLCWVGSSSFGGTCSTTTNRNQYFNYDADGDLFQYTDSSGSTYYGYNLAGELCYSGSNSGTDVSTNCPSTPSGDTSYHNDAAGNLTGTSTNPTQLAYNSDDQATSLAPLSGGSGDTATYEDQGNQLRTAVAPASGPTDYLDDGPLGITAVSNSSGTTFYTRDPFGQLIDERFHPAGGGATVTHYYVTDRLGSVVNLFDSSASDVGNYTYAPYGQITNSLSAAAQANPFRYTGAYQDTEGDNYYHLGARYYDPTTRRFTQPDTVTGNAAEPNTLNRYAYTDGDPVNDIDPTGHNAFSNFVSGAYDEATSFGQSFAKDTAYAGVLGGALGGLEFGLPGAAVGGLVGGVNGYLEGYATGFAAGAVYYTAFHL